MSRPQESFEVGEGIALVPLRRRAPRTAEQPIAHSHGRRDYVTRRGLAVADALGIVGAALVAFLASPLGPRPEDALLVAAVLPVWLLLFRAYGLYERDVKRISHFSLDEVPSLFHALLLGTLGLWAYMKLIDVHPLVFAEVVVFAATALVAIPTFRAVSRRLVRRAFGAERVLLIGGSTRTRNLMSKLRAHPEYALKPIGLLSVEGANGSAPPVPELGRVNASDLGGTDLPAILDDNAVERVIVAAEDIEDPLLLRVVEEAEKRYVKVSLLPSYVQALGPALEVDEIEGLTVLGLNPLVLPRFSRAMKRGLDVIVAGLALAVTLPLLALIALGIKLESRGPVLFRQRRIGRGGEPFTMIKFRTMRAGAESEVEALRNRSEDPNWLLIDDDPRVTRLGRLLRAASLDELPQLWNVLKGEMSLVGPRPLVGEEDALVIGWDRTRLGLSPGLTGLWQVLGRTSIPFEEMVKLDYLYVTNWSLWTDVKLIIRTVPAVMRRQGVN